jgi:glucose-6-phosphate isomerase
MSQMFINHDSNITKYVEARRILHNEILSGDIKALSIAFDDEYYESLSQKASQIKSKYDNIFICGMGGSFLGSKTIIEGTLPKDFHKIKFIYNVEQSVLLPELNEISDKDLIIFISKSGNTKETLHILETLLQVKPDFKNIISITENKEGSLYKKSIANQFEILKHEPVCGRFSFLTNVGILPSLLAGFEIKDFLKGVRKAINEIPNKESEFYNFLDLQISDKKINLNILMPYSSKLQSMTHWFCQLYAESLSRNNFKIMPFPSLGTIDQHSLLEGYLQNPHDKLITFIIKKEDSLLFNEYLLTKKICIQQGLKVREFEFEKIEAEELGYIMGYFVIEVLLISKILNINPFIQEMVDKRKLF